MLKTETMLTTEDNPYSPFRDFWKWYQFDIEKGYDSCGLLARIAKTSSNLTESENDDEIDRAIDQIIRLHAGGMYRKVTEEVEEPD